MFLLELNLSVRPIQTSKTVSCSLIELGDLVSMRHLCSQICKLELMDDLHGGWCREAIADPEPRKQKVARH